MRSTAGSMDRGWSPTLKAFVHYEGANAVDAAVLLSTNHLGLYAEQIRPHRKQQQGRRLPQALTHLALISAAFNPDRALGA